MDRIATYLISEARAADDTLYHFTSSSAAVSIIQSDEFNLSGATGLGAEEALAIKGRPFYLSTTRHRLGGFSLRTGGGVMLNLDGNKLSNRHVIKPVDYWGFEFAEIERTKQEAEDRVYSTRPQIKNAVSYIKEIHILYRDIDQHDATKANVRRLLVMAKTRNIPVFLYDRLDNFLQQRSPIKVPAADMKRSEVYDPKTIYRSRYDGNKYLKPLVELIQKPVDQALSADGRRELWTLDYSDTHSTWSASLHNARRSKYTQFIITFMNKMGLSTLQELQQWVANKWKDVR